jgi:hypothetical protein
MRRQSNKMKYQMNRSIRLVFGTKEKSLRILLDSTYRLESIVSIVLKNSRHLQVHLLDDNGLHLYGGLLRAVGIVLATKV